LVGITFKKNAEKEWVIKTIKSFGTPIVVATDKRKVPKVVRKVASTFNAKLFFPKNDMKEEEKEKLCKNLKFQNLHERDAYSAAKKAYNYFENKFRQAERIAKEHNTDSERLKYLVVRSIKMADGY
jgi:predicted RNase H-like nuclease (RuvC/YqgF family)